MKIIEVLNKLIVEGINSQTEMQSDHNIMVGIVNGKLEEAIKRINVMR